jgi:hypothetical protein
MPMQFVFCHNNEYRCPQISHCPHLGNAAMGTFFNLANQNQQERDATFRASEAHREQISRHLAEIQRLEKELAQAKLELKLERQNKFDNSQQKAQSSETPESASGKQTKAGSKKRPVPVGYPKCPFPRVKNMVMCYSVCL